MTKRFKPVSSLIAVGLLTAAAVTFLGGNVAYHVVTPSMEPEYPVGTLVLAGPTDVDTLDVGDVILFKAPVPGEPTYLHRLVSIDEEGAGVVYRTKGDANDAADPWEMTFTSDIAWTPKHQIPYGGKVLSVLQSRAVKISGILTIGLSMTWSVLRFVWSRPTPEQTEGGDADEPR